jgi:hypothetical protein
MIPDDINDALLFFDEISFKLMVASRLKPTYRRSALTTIKYLKWCYFQTALVAVVVRELC